MIYIYIYIYIYIIVYDSPVRGLAGSSASGRTRALLERNLLNSTVSRTRQKKPTPRPMAAACAKQELLHLLATTTSAMITTGKASWLNDHTLTAGMTPSYQRFRIRSFRMSMEFRTTALSSPSLTVIIRITCCYYYQSS